MSIKTNRGKHRRQAKQRLRFVHGHKCPECVRGDYCGGEHSVLS